MTNLTFKQLLENRRISKEVFNRLDGEVNLRDLSNLKKYANAIIEDLYDEGFDRDDINGFLCEIIKKI